MCGSDYIYELICIVYCSVPTAFGQFVFLSGLRLRIIQSFLPSGDCHVMLLMYSILIDVPWIIINMSLF